MIDVQQIKHCPTCNRDLATELFPISKDKKDGLFYECKECHARRERERVARLKRGEIPTHRRCSACGEVKPLDAEHFHHRTNRQAGFQYWCKVCSNTKAIMRHRRQGDTETETEALSNGHKPQTGVSKAALGTPDQCGACGREYSNIFGDVDDTTRKQYGYLCAKCLNLTRTVQADTERTRKVLVYLERTRKVKYTKNRLTRSERVSRS